MVFTQEIIYLKRNISVCNECCWVQVKLGTHWIVIYVNVDNVAYFDSLGVEYNSK